MESLSFDIAGPKAFILASADKLSPYNPANDQVWELKVDRSETHPFYLHTSYNLRAKSMRVFPNFVYNNKRLTVRDDCQNSPRITTYSPDSIQVQFCLKDGVDIQFDAFIAEPDVLIGGLELNNTGKHPIRLIVEMAAILAPMDKGVPTHPNKKGLNQIITGQTGNLYPVLFMTGGPTAVNNPFPALTLPMQINPSESKKITWVLVSKESQSLSFEEAKKITAKPWRVDMQTQRMNSASQTIKIHTGFPDWNTTFQLSQTHGMLHKVAKGSSNAETFFVRTRLPDQPLPSAQAMDVLDDLTTLEATHLAQVLLPTNSSVFSDVAENFLARINSDEQLTTQRNASLFKQSIRECPLIANLCLEIFEINGDAAFLGRVLPKLCQITDAWLYSHHDTENLQPLVWKDPQQCQLNTGMFMFDIWEKTGRGVDIQYAESPALATMLLREVQSLKIIAKHIGDKINLKKYSGLEKTLTEKVESFWKKEWDSFAYHDRQSKQSPTSDLLSSGSVQNYLDLNKVFSSPQRLQLHLTTKDEYTRVCTVRFEGINLQGERFVEEFKASDIHWVLGRAHLTSENLFNALLTMSLEGMKPEDEYVLETVGFSQSDVTCLLPIWSSVIDEEKMQSILQNNLVMINPAIKHSIPETWKCEKDLPESLPIYTNILWNTLIISGLANVGQTQAAVELFTNLMSTIIKGLKDYDGFFPFFNRDNGHPTGQPNTIASLVPVRLFLQICGIRLFTPARVAVWGANPFPWPIEVQWRGLSLRREGTYTKVVFPDGSVYESDSDKSVLLTADEDQFQR